MLILLILILIFLSLFSFFYNKNYQENFMSLSRNPRNIASYSQKYYKSTEDKPVQNYNLEEVQMIESNPYLFTNILD